MAGQHSHGMTLHRSEDASNPPTDNTFELVAEVVDINPPTKSRTKIPTTPHSSTNETSIAGRIVAHGHVTLMLNFLPDSEETHRDLEADFDNAEVRWFRVTTPAPTSRSQTFQGWVMRFDVSTPEDDRVTAEVEIVVTGAVTTVN